MTTVLIYTSILGIISLAYFKLVKKFPDYQIPRFCLVDIHKWNIRLSRVFLWIIIPTFLGLITFMVEGNLPFPETPSLPHVYAMIILPMMYIGFILKTLLSVKESKGWCLKLGVNKTQLIPALVVVLLGIYVKLVELKDN